MMMIGNKSDLEEQRDVSYDDAKALADENNLMFLECSAKSCVLLSITFWFFISSIYSCDILCCRYLFVNLNTAVLLFSPIVYVSFSFVNRKTMLSHYPCLFIFSGENVEEVFLETARKIYQNVQEGRYVVCSISVMFYISVFNLCAYYQHYISNFTWEIFQQRVCRFILFELTRMSLFTVGFLIYTFNCIF